MEPTLETPVQFVKGVGPKLAEKFKEKNVTTIGDLLRRFPRAYEDQTSLKTIEEFEPDEVTVTTVEVVQVNHRRLRGRRRLLEWVCTDDTGTMKVLFFRFTPGFHLAVKGGDQLRLVGKPTLRGRTWQMTHPQFLVIKTETLTEEDSATIRPIYPETHPMTQQKWQKVVETALQMVKFQEDTFPESLAKRLSFPPIDEAVRLLHKPPPESDFGQLQNGVHPAFIRFVFEELFFYELGLLLNKDRHKKIESYKIVGESPLWRKLRAQLPFQLTGDQEKVIAELVETMSKGERAYSLIQGDVGSGKTLVALALACHAIDSGVQAVVMAPTELLAEQHFKNIKALVAGLDIEVDLLTGSLKAQQRTAVLRNIKQGITQIAVGTHALIQKGVDFCDLGLVLIDEQHRFGVEQRLKLSEKGLSPHQIHMTATPIPRTLAMTFFGDMDLHTIKEKPVGRKPIRTKWVKQKRRESVYTYMAQEIAKGRQAYVVFPLIEESETLELKNATDEFAKLKSDFPDIKMELLHGRLTSQEREGIMRQFVEGKLQVLVATTVIEVGVDVANATLMIIENAERFGLSQLHQLRGRVGRGGHESWCVLVTGHAVSEEGRVRLGAMEESDDGFFIAEKDLEIRGAGEILGSKQSGMPTFRYADIAKHQEVMMSARRFARELIDEGDTVLLKQLEARVRELYADRIGLLKA